MTGRYCCSPALLNTNYDCLLFDPKDLNLKQPFYQHQILVSRFYSFLRCVAAEEARDV